MSYCHRRPLTTRMGRRPCPLCAQTRDPKRPQTRGHSFRPRERRPQPPGASVLTRWHPLAAGPVHSGIPGVDGRHQRGGLGEWPSRCDKETLRVQDGRHRLSSQHTCCQVKQSAHVSTRVLYTIIYISLYSYVCSIGTSLISRRRKKVVDVACLVVAAHS